jgi:hypothetical protein
MTLVRRLAVLTSLLGVAVGVAGCGGSISASQIANDAKSKYNQQFASQGKTQRLASVSCPRDLSAKKGNSEVCTAVGTPGNVALNVTATIVSVSGSTAHFHFEISVASHSGGGGGTGTSTG